jgi:hypothetical protein
MLLPGTASAAPTVAISGVTVTGGSAAVTGTVSFEPITTPQSVIKASSVWARGAFTTTDAGAAAGLQLTDATLTPISNGLRFTWHVSSLPEQVPPEVARYAWAFQIGGRIYQFIAKRTNLVTISVAEDPLGHVQRLASQKPFFQLRGNCSGAYLGAPLNGCAHLGFVEGGLDSVNKKIWVDLPYEAKDAVGRVMVPEFRPGAVLDEYAGAFTGSTAVSASLQYGALSHPTASVHVTQSVNGISSYYTAPQVALAAGAANLEDFSGVTFNSLATISSGTFSGTVNGLTATKNTVYARACHGTQCTYTSLKAL